GATRKASSCGARAQRAPTRAACNSTPSSTARAITASSWRWTGRSTRASLAGRRGAPAPSPAASPWPRAQAPAWSRPPSPAGAWGGGRGGDGPDGCVLEGWGEGVGLRRAGAPFVQNLPDRFPAGIRFERSGEVWRGPVRADALSGTVTFTGGGAQPRVVYEAD